MAKFSNTNIHVLGCVTKEQTLILHPTSETKSAHLLPNSAYRIVAEEDTVIDFTASGVANTAGDLSAASGVYLPKDMPEIFTTTTDRVYLHCEQATASGAVYVSRVLS